MHFVLEVPDSYRDLLEAQFATLATISKDGGPQLTEVWFLFEDGKVKISLNDSRQSQDEEPAGAAAMQPLHPRSRQDPFRYVDVRGTAVVSRRTTTTSSPSGSAPSTAAPIWAEHDGPGDRRVVVTIEPTNVYATDMTGR